MKQDSIHLGQNIKRIRKEKGLSQETLAQRIGCPRPRISDLEHRKSATIPTIEKVAAGLGVQPFELLIPRI